MTKPARVRAALRGVRRAVGRTLAGLQGVAGVGALAAGVLLQFGRGWALIVAGVFLLLGAWTTGGRR